MDLPDLEMAGRSGAAVLRPRLSELIPLPEGSELFVLPDRAPVGIDPCDGLPSRVPEDPTAPGAPARAVAAFVAPAHTSLYTVAYEKLAAAVAPLPLFAYTAVGWLDGRFWVAAFRSDPDPRQDADRYRQRTVRAKTRQRLKKFPDNRLIQHLGKCCLTYGCPAARNYFLDRWEAPVPTSPQCNAGCIGCISLQTSGCCPSSQERIPFVPSPDEIVAMAVPHLIGAPRPIVSFGQGCEGEPLMQAKVIERAIKTIRKQTARGTINLNTNASMPGRVERLARAGLDSIRVSLNSARPEKHRLYYRPRGFSLAEVTDSIRVMKRQNKFVSLNYFILPGFTDDPEEMSALFDLVETFRPDLIQLRNLNMDPEWYMETVQHRPTGAARGVLKWLGMLKREFPFLRFGYFNPYLGEE
ncbi:MAG: radical SAM protein [Nitrospirota bacterium]